MEKTAYEMRISDWSSDVCSSDLLLECARDLGHPAARPQCPSHLARAGSSTAGLRKDGDRRRWTAAGQLRAALRENATATGELAGRRNLSPHGEIGSRFPARACRSGSSERSGRSEEHTSEHQSLIRNSYAD